MTNKYLKPMLDAGSPRVFNCNEMTRRILEKTPDAPAFFRNKRLNNIVLIKDTVPENERNIDDKTVGTKLYFPFNETNIYEGGRTIYFHAPNVDKAITDYCGEGAITRESLSDDMRLILILDRLPSLDPFLMKDVYLRQKIKVNEAYFEVSEEAWNEIEAFMIDRFTPLVHAAFPEIQESDDRARQLIDKIWEARDIDALMPLIEGFRLPKEKALDIFASWKGIVYYSFLYQRQQSAVLDLVKWFKENQDPVAGVSAAEIKDLQSSIAQIRDRLRIEWQTVEEIVRAYENSYNKMFRDKTSSSDFLAFLRDSNETYWKIGNSLGKINHAHYCWDAMTNRYEGRRLPWALRLEVMRLLARIFEPEKKASTSVSWS